MARNNRGGRGNRGQNNNPEGRNQYSGGVMDIYRERPMAAALGTAAAVGAGVFLWSRRNQISDQISNLSDQIGEWREGLGSSSEGQFDDTAGLATTGGTGSSNNMGTTSRTKKSKGKSQTELSEEALSLKQTGDNF